MDFWVIIPARYASTRLPGKPLLEIAGRPMLRHVYERACAAGASKVLIATDDERIAGTAETFGAEVCMTASSHRSGTDRVAEAARLNGAEDACIIVNVQGDEPLLPSSLIRQAAEALHKTQADISTLCSVLTSGADCADPNQVKLVRDKNGFALYFSRAPVPWLRDDFTKETQAAEMRTHYRHIGLYAYRCAYLQKLTKLPPCALEEQEKLEQLRALYHGARIYVEEAREEPGPGIDTPDDLALVRKLLAQP